MSEVRDAKATQRQVPGIARVVGESPVVPCCMIAGVQEAVAGEGCLMFSERSGSESVADAFAIDLPHSGHHRRPKPGGHLRLSERTTGSEMPVGEDVSRGEHRGGHDSP